MTSTITLFVGFGAADLTGIILANFWALPLPTCIRHASASPPCSLIFAISMSLSPKNWL
jgi:hypothetical protein